MSRGATVLRKIIEALVEEFGADRVYRTLDGVINGGLERDAPKARPSKGVAERKKTGVDLVESLDGIDDEKRILLLRLAKRFDSREFVLSSSDYRRFMGDYGQRAVATKSRIDAFRHILRVAVKISADELRRLSESTAYSGPARLDTISEAISSRGASIRSSDSHENADEGLGVAPGRSKRDKSEH